ncbi:intraflagellar transport protein 56 isoform X1 [Dermacentor albipictus]|uniref:intraflagellar transport protein 56 isoform X1 n=1 Tax=Dermacentor albipictus TaxID=60249 RepID=UPI0038FC0D4B
MLLSRTKPAVAGVDASSASSADGDGLKVEHQRQQKSAESRLPTLEEFLEKRDFTGAMSLLEFTGTSSSSSQSSRLEAALWTAYCAFHLGQHRQAMRIYQELLADKSMPPPLDVWSYLACCQFHLGLYREAEASVLKGPKNQLQSRLLFHLAHKAGDEKRLMALHQSLQDILEDQLSLASIHYLRAHYQEAIDIYKRILLENRDFLALNVYVALCYYKLDYYDVSQEVLAVYLQNFPDSATAINLKACNHFRLYNGKAAEAELKSLRERASPTFTYAQDLIKHNLVVFRGGEGALQVLPGLVGAIPEARLNLVIYYLKQDNIQEAHNLIKDLEPTVPHEYILKGVVNAAIGQAQGSREHLKIAQQFFQLVGGSASECDTIPGRQCMASCFFLLKQFDDVLLYLNSIKSYFYNDDTFNFNYAQAKAATRNFKEAEEVFLMIQSDKIKSSYIYQSWLTRCYIMNGKPQQAWELYQSMDTSSESFSLLQLLANDCYKMGHFLYAARGFDLLEKMDANPEYWEGKRGACVGTFQRVIAGRDEPDCLREIVEMLKTESHSQAESISKVIRGWCKEKKIALS